jgi:hypothetical protein
MLCQFVETTEETLNMALIPLQYTQIQNMDNVITNICVRMNIYLNIPPRFSQTQ